MIKPVCSGEGEREGEGRKRRGEKGREGEKKAGGWLLAATR